MGRGEGAYHAFVPAPLPPRLELAPGLVALLSEADRAVGRLGGVGQNLPNPHLLIGPFKRREAVLSSRIEGTQASFSDLLLFEVVPEGEQRVEDVLEVSNYVRALDHGLARQRTLPMSLRLIREMHRLLMEGVRGQQRDPGEFRRVQNWIGPTGCDVTTANYVPPPPDELPGALSSFEKYLHAPGDLPALVRVALMHYQFEAIHPFLDGNGRIGRLLITLMLCTDGVLPGPLLYLSAYFERRREEYYAGLLAVSREGKWEEWIEFVLHGVKEQADDAVRRATKLMSLRATYRARLSAQRASARALELSEMLFDTPAISVGQAAKRLGVTARGAQQVVDKLVKADVLREVTGKKRGRVYVAWEVVGVVE
jgi:Fic family protein